MEVLYYNFTFKYSMYINLFLTPFIFWQYCAICVFIYFIYSVFWTFFLDPDYLIRLDYLNRNTIIQPLGDLSRRCRHFEMMSHIFPSVFIEIVWYVRASKVLFLATKTQHIISTNKNTEKFQDPWIRDNLLGRYWRFNNLLVKLLMIWWDYV